MEILRFLLVTFICGWFIYYLGRVVLTALRSGVIHHTDSKKFFIKSKNPIAFWSLVLLFALLISLAVIAWERTLIAIF